MDKSNAREKARCILANALGLEQMETESGENRPADSEDFYLLGGTSLMVAIALDTLRQNGFRTNMDVFISTGNIGRLLDSLFEHEVPEEIEQVAKPYNFRDNEITGDMEGVVIKEWIQDSTAISESMYNELLELFVTEFDRSEILGQAFGIRRSDIEDVFRACTHPETNCILIAATYEPTFSMPLYGASPDKILGAVLALPTKKMPTLRSNERLLKLEKYFAYAQDVRYSENLDLANALTVMMLAVQTPEVILSLHRFESVACRWNRLKVQVLLKLEQEVIKIAKMRNFSMVETINTSQATKEACVGLGYETQKIVHMREFAEQMQIDADPRFSDHRSYYMIKLLNE